MEHGEWMKNQFGKIWVTVYYLFLYLSCEILYRISIVLNTHFKAEVTEIFYFLGLQKRICFSIFDSFL